MVVTVRVTVPEGTVGDVFVAGSVPELGPWKADALKLTPDPAEARTYVGEFPADPGTRIAFKFTRGTWNTVEKGPQGEERDNRAFAVPPEGGRISASVDRWAAGGPAPRPSTVSGTLVLHEAFESKSLGNKRTLRVWLPPGYEAQKEQRYPVLYLHDGQNLFDAATSAFGTEWGLDESATSLIADGKIRPAILVGIDNTPDRISEYTADKAGPVGGKADAYAKFLVGEVKPFIDRTYRTRPEREHTLTGGSSLGGVVSLELLTRHPDTFGGAAIVSPALWWADRAILNRVAAPDLKLPPDTRVYLDMGTREGAPGQWGSYVEDARKLRDLLKAKGLTVEYQEAEGAEHNEAAWSKRAPGILTFLLPK